MALMVQWGIATYTSIYSTGAHAASVKRCRNSYGSLLLALEQLGEPLLWLWEGSKGFLVEFTFRLRSEG